MIVEPWSVGMLLTAAAVLGAVLIGSVLWHLHARTRRDERAALRDLADFAERFRKKVAEK